MSQFAAEKFTTRSREAIELAQVAATTSGHSATEPIHLLLALLRAEDGGTSRSLVTKAGVDPELMLEILENSAAKSGLIAFKAPYVFRRDFSTNFSVKWMHKDISIMLESASEQNVPLPLTSLTQQMFRAAIAEGYGDDDICSTIKVLEGITGVEVKKK